MSVLETNELLTTYGGVFSACLVAFAFVRFLLKSVGGRY